MHFILKYFIPMKLFYGFKRLIGVRQINKMLQHREGGNNMSRRKLVENFINENINSAYRFAFTYMKNQHDAEDVVSESIIRALKAADSVKDPERIKPWFFRIVSNTAITQIKKKQKVVPFESMENEDIYEDSYSISDLNEMIEKLPKEYMEIIVLRFFEDMKIKDVAEVLDINENTAKTRLYKALRLLKEDMVDYYE